MLFRCLLLPMWLRRGWPYFHLTVNLLANDWLAVGPMKWKGMCARWLWGWYFLLWRWGFRRKQSIFCLWWPRGVPGSAPATLPLAWGQRPQEVVGSTETPASKTHLTARLPGRGANAYTLSAILRWRFSITRSWSYLNGHNDFILNCMIIWLTKTSVPTLLPD